MANLEFDPALTPDENIDRFFAHLSAQFPEAAALLKANIGQLLPFPTDSGARSTARAKFHKAIAVALDKALSQPPAPKAT